MSLTFWLRRFMLMFFLAFIVVVCAHVLRGHELMVSLAESLLWAVISANIFMFTRIYHSRKGGYCALFNDIAENQHRQSVVNIDSALIQPRYANL